MPHDHSDSDETKPTKLHVLSSGLPKKSPEIPRAFIIGKGGPGLSSAMKPDAHVHGAHVHEEKKELRLTVLAASLLGKDAKDWVSEHNSGLLAAASIALVGADIASNTIVGHSTIAQINGLGETVGIGGLALSLIGMNDSSENLIENAHELEHTQGVPRFVTASLGAASHAIPEAGVTTVTTLSGNAGVNVASLFTGKITHMGIMLWGAAAAGTMGALDRENWRIHAKGIGKLSAAFAAAIMVGDYAPPVMMGEYFAPAAKIGLGGLMAFKLAPDYIKELRKPKIKETVKCIVHGDHCSGHHHGDDHEEDEQAFPKAPPVKLSLKERAEILRAHIENAPYRMTKIPAQTASFVKRANEYRKDPAARKAFLSAVTLAASSVVMHDSVEILSEAFALSQTSAGFIRGTTLSASETFFTLKAALKKDFQMAWGSLTGCMAAGALLEGATLMANPEIPDLLRTTPHMAAYGLTVGGGLMLLSPKAVELMAKVDNVFADRLQNRLQGVSNWLRNDGKTLSKTVALPAALASLGYLGYASTLPDMCHSHGLEQHCGADATTDSSGESLMNLPGLDGP